MQYKPDFFSFGLCIGAFCLSEPELSLLLRDRSESPVPAPWDYLFILKSTSLLLSLLSITLILMWGMGIWTSWTSSTKGRVSKALILELRNYGVWSSVTDVFLDGVLLPLSYLPSKILRGGFMTLLCLCCSSVCRMMYLISKPGVAAAPHDKSFCCFRALLLTFRRIRCANVCRGEL